jgi:hypothetical protein
VALTFNLFGLELRGLGSWVMMSIECIESVNGVIVCTCTFLDNGDTVPTESEKVKGKEEIILEPPFYSK